MQRALGATEWSNGQVINLGGLPGFTSSVAMSINAAGRVVGSSGVGGRNVATEWSNGEVINLGGLPGFTSSEALSINAVGQVGGWSIVGNQEFATEWSNGQVINLGPGLAYGINGAGQVVGFSDEGLGATEWSNGQVINLGGLPGALSSVATSINDAGQVVGFSYFQAAEGQVIELATEWSNGQVINLGPVWAFGINDAGQVVGGGPGGATEWSNGQVINLGGLPGTLGSGAEGINDAGQVVGFSVAPIIPETSTWAMMLLGFAALGFLSYRSAGGRCSSRTVYSALPFG